MHSERLEKLQKDMQPVHDAVYAATEAFYALAATLAVDPATIHAANLDVIAHVTIGGVALDLPIDPDQLKFADVPAMLDHAIGNAEAAYQEAMVDLARAVDELIHGRPDPDAELSASQAAIAEQLGVPTEVVDGR